MWSAPNARRFRFLPERNRHACTSEVVAMFRCPRCGEHENTEELDDNRCYCPGCSCVWKPEQEPRLIQPEPRTRRDLE